MALATPKIPYNTLRDAILTLLRDNYVALNLGLIKQFDSAKLTKQITKGLPTVEPSYTSDYPYIFVNIGSKDEEFAGLGAGGRKEGVVVFNLTAITRVVGTSGTNDEDDCYYLASNIEGLFRNNIQFNTAILLSSPIRTEFNLAINKQGVYVSSCNIQIMCQIDIS